jgi:hypothetical protein
MRPTAADLDSAKQLLASPGSASKSPEEQALLAVRAYQRLSDRLAPLIGAAGLEALLVRSVKLTKADYPSMGDYDGGEATNGHAASPAERLRACLASVDATAASSVVTSLYGTLHGLLRALIGQELVRQILRSAFPAMNDDVQEETEQ